MANLRQLPLAPTGGELRFMFTKEKEQGNPCNLSAQTPRRMKRTQPRAIRIFQKVSEM